MRRHTTESPVSGALVSSEKGSTAGKLNGKYVTLKEKDWLLHRPDCPHSQVLSRKQFPESVFFLNVVVNNI